MKIFFKKILLVILLICILVPSLFTGFVLADTDNIKLNQERVGNYTATFAINFFENWSSKGKISTGYTKETKGETKTEYDENATAAQVNEGDDTYKFNNISWVNFVYRKALKYNFDVISADSVRSDYFDGKKELYGDAVVKESEILDISKLISEGQVKPGDILVVNNGMGNLEYLLYVGGNKVIYAAPPAVSDEGVADDATGALKYDYLALYLEKIRNKLMEQYDSNNNSNSDEENTENTATNKEDKEKIITSYGIQNVYRIRKDKAEQITEGNVTTFYNGKGYYNVAKYEGIVADDYVVGKFERKGDFIFNGIAKLLKFFLNLIVYIIKMQVVGWANIVESLLQTVLLGITGNNGETRGDDAFLSAPPTSSSGKRVTVESVFFNNIPIFDINFFDTEFAGGYPIAPAVTNDNAAVPQDGSTGPVLPDTQDSTTNTGIVAQVNNEDANIVYIIRKNIATWYFILRNLALAIMLIILIYVGIRIATSTLSEKKAMYKRSLMGWVTGFIIICFIDMFMYVVIASNQMMVDMFKEIAEDNASEIIYEEEANREEGREEINLYDAVRIKAYSFELTESVPATVIYIFLIYMLIRFSFVYAKRVITIYVLALMGPIIGVKYAFDSASGKRPKILNSWMKDFAFNVFLQTIHVMLYAIYMSVALSVAQTDLAGFLICLIILNAMLKADKIVINIFGLNKSANLGDVNNEKESWKSWIQDFVPIATATTGMFSRGKDFFVGKRGIIAEIRYLGTGKDNYKDAEKEIDKENFAIKAGIAKFLLNNRLATLIGTGISKTPIGKMKSVNAYLQLLGRDVSYDTKKKIYDNIKNVRKLKTQRFTRNLKFAYDVGTGLAGMGASVGLAVANPLAGYTLFKQNKKKIDSYRTLDKNVRKNSLYGGTRENSKLNYKRAEKDFKAKMNYHVEKQYEYEQKLDKYKVERQELKNDLKANPDSEALKQKLRDLDSEIIGFMDNRKLENAKEMQDLQGAQELVAQRKIEYGNAKHEDRALNGVRTAFETAIGARMFEDMARNERNANFKSGDKLDKEMSKLEDISKVVDAEEELRALTKELKAEQERYIEENKSLGIDEKLNDEEKSKIEAKNEKDLRKSLKDSLNESINETKKLNVQVSTIKEAVSQYMAEYNVSAITPKDVNMVLDNIEKLVEDNSTRKIEFDSETREKVRKALKAKMVKDSKGNGYNKKDAITSLRTIFGQDGVLQITSTEDIPDEKIKDLQEKIIRKINQINTYNEVGKVKYKQGLVNTNKVVKDAKKGK